MVHAAREKSRCDARRADLKIRVALLPRSPVVSRQLKNERFTMRQDMEGKQDFDVRIGTLGEKKRKDVASENTAMQLSFGLIS